MLLFIIFIVLVYFGYKAIEKYDPIAYAEINDGAKRIGVLIKDLFK